MKKGWTNWTVGARQQTSVNHLLFTPDWGIWAPLSSTFSLSDPTGCGRVSWIPSLGWMIYFYSGLCFHSSSPNISSELFTLATIMAFRCLMNCWLYVKPTSKLYFVASLNAFGVLQWHLAFCSKMLQLWSYLLCVGMLYEWGKSENSTNVALKKHFEGWSNPALLNVLVPRDSVRSSSIIGISFFF